MSFYNYEAVSNITTAIATIQEFLDRYFQKKEDLEVAISILLTASEKEISENKIIVKTKNIPRIKELFAVYDITGKKKYLEIPEEIEMSVEQLSLLILKSVVGIKDKDLEDLNRKIDVLEFALKYVWWNKPWVEYCLYELDRTYRRCLAQDRLRYDRRITEALDASIKYVASVVRGIGLFEAKSQKFERIKEEIIEDEEDFEED
ncbi:MAG: hypothetical protein ACTSRP_07355 [Candidatus Helarchaeota archaeon]